jgi:hypothetical protein
MIHTFGDSHAWFAWDQIEGVSTNRIGPITAQSFGRKKLEILDISEPRFNVAPGDYVCFSFGEIDCRCHIGKFRSSSRMLMDSIAKNYFEAINANIEKMPGVKVMVYNIPPTLRKADAKENVDFPFYGEDAERAEYIRYMNERYKELCGANDFLFVDVYNDYADKYGFLQKELSDNMIHIQDPVYIREFVKNNIV